MSVTWSSYRFEFIVNAYRSTVRKFPDPPPGLACFVLRNMDVISSAACHDIGVNIIRVWGNRRNGSTGNELDESTVVLKPSACPGGGDLVSEVRVNAISANENRFVGA